MAHLKCSFQKQMIFFMFLFLSLGCASNVPLGQLGERCEFDEQCDKTKHLTCLCLIKKAPDEEGPDQIISYGRCLMPGSSCGKDAGITNDATK